MYTIKLPDSLRNYTFVEASAIMKMLYHVTLFGLYLNHSVVLNPASHVLTGCEEGFIITSEEITAWYIC